MKTVITPKTTTFFIAFLSSAIASAQISINQRSHIVMNGNVSLVVNNAAFNNNGNFAAGSGTVAFSGNTDSTTAYIGGSNKSVFYNLSVSKNNGGIAIKASTDVKNTLEVNSGTLYTDNNLTLKSDETLTARVAPVSGQISGKATVERYIPARRAWRMLTAPLTNTGSIFNNWQNAGVYEQGINTYVTGSNPGAANGLDASPQNNSSMKTWNAATQQFNSVSNTYTALSAGNSGSADNTGYFMFVRGDRTQANFSTTTCNATTLKSNGELQTGNQRFYVSSNAGAYTMVGNPYASPVDFSQLSRHNMVNRFYVWDPTLNAVGGYVMFDDLHNTGTYTKSVGASNMSKDIQSGQAFFVQTRYNGSTYITFNENDKSSYNNTQAFRPSANPSFQSLRINLDIVNEDSTKTVADGIFAEFAEDYSAVVDLDDAVKFSNINENIAFVRNGSTLAAERRPLIEGNDTLFIKLWKTTPRNYQFTITPGDMDAVNIILQDTYLNSNTRISGNGSTTINFSIDANAASADMNRFRIIFKKYNTLPVTISSIVATVQNNGNKIEWKVENELNIEKYEIEKSLNGTDFQATGAVIVASNSNLYNTYSWLDVTAAQGTNFYRIKVYDRNGDTKYSSIVKASSTKTNNSSISIYPNPVKGSIINVLLGNQPKGNYQMKLISLSGQVLYTGTLNSNSGNGILVINVPVKLTTGIYKLEVITPAGNTEFKNVMAE